MARLVIFDASVRGVDLPDRPVTLGRSRTVDVPIRDKILSRKHCTITPGPTGLSLIDLKSANGTYLNGRRIDRSSLKADDVIEIGSTVIVLLDNSTWKQGSPPARLRNPGKAKELVRALRDGAAPKGESSPAVGVRRPEKNAPLGRRPGRRLERTSSTAPSRKDRKKMQALEAVFSQWAATGILASPGAAELLEGYLLHHVVSLAARHSSELRGVLAACLERLLGSEAFQGDMERTRAAVRQALTEVLAKRREPSSGGP
jgi:pSer/pThr/pTyr-binding forkhead associated (FHA) protein